MNQNTFDSLRVFKATITFQHGLVEDTIHSYTIDAAQDCAERAYPSAQLITVEEQTSL